MGDVAGKWGDGWQLKILTTGSVWKVGYQCIVEYRQQFCVKQIYTVDVDRKGWQALGLETFNYKKRVQN